MSANHPSAVSIALSTPNTTEKSAIQSRWHLDSSVYQL